MASLPVARAATSPIDSKSEDKSTSEWKAQLYAVQEVKDEEIEQWYETYRYKGFEREQVIKELKEKVGDIKIAQQIIMICGMQGPQRAALTKLMNGRTIASYGIPASGLKGSKGISCQRITAATADLCAYLLKKVNIPKRINTNLPSWLQFPSAGSIILPDDLRALHYDFAKRFSTVIGGVFNEQIYMQMMNNAYLNTNLHLFDDHVQAPTTAVAISTIPPPAPSFNPARGSVGRTKTSDSNKPGT
jgi:hypothetical protein